MSSLFQIILINIVVSCDNVGVIALATKDLPKEQAKSARKLGIGLSLVLKIIFIGIISFLFEISWLHIRIIGGIMLLYVTYHMLHQSGCPASEKKSRAADSYMLAIFSIIAADISMSLDNVIAILSIVSSDGKTLTLNNMLIIVIGLLACVPVLLWFSETISRLMERFPSLTYICAGYLIYIAVKMIFEDEIFLLFFKYIGFSFTTQLSILCGTLAVISCLITQNAKSRESSHLRKGILLGYGFSLLYAFIMICVLSYMYIHPTPGEILYTTQDLYSIIPNGANAGYTLGISSHIFSLCACFMTGLIMKTHITALTPRFFLLRWKQSICCMLIFMTLYFSVTTIGLSIKFGFGTIHPKMYIFNIILQVLTNIVYVSVAAMFTAFIKNRTIMTIISMLAIHAGTALAEFLLFGEHWKFLLEMLPGYFLGNLQSQDIDIRLLIKALIIAVMWIIITTRAGYEKVCSSKT